MNEVIDVLKYGWQGLIIAFIICIIIGIVKTPIKGALKKKYGEDIGKKFGAICLGISVVVGVIGAIAYCAIYNPFAMVGWECVLFILWVVSVSQFMYAMYEKLGMRDFFKWFLKKACSAFGIKLPINIDELIETKTETKKKEEDL